MKKHNTGNARMPRGSMKLEINTTNDAAKNGQLKNFIYEFINDKINSVRQHQHEALLPDDQSETIWKKYLASLWMVTRRLNIQDEQEVARRAGITPEMLRSWQQEKYFNALVAEHYSEFLEWIIALLA